MARPAIVMGFLAAALLAGSGVAQEAAPEGSGDWPCVQRKVPTLTSAVVWTGPPIEEGEVDWASDAQVAALAGRLSQRRVTLEEAEREVEAFADGLGEDAPERLTALFAGVFETMNAERSEVMEGVERYARRQIDMADEIRAEASTLDRLRTAPDTDLEAVLAAEDALAWRTRVFDERRASLTYACDVPRLIEQRLFALGATIAARIEGG